MCFSKEMRTYFNTNIYFYLETSGGQSSNPYLNIAHFLTPVLIRHLCQLKTVVFLHWCLIRVVLLCDVFFYFPECLIHCGWSHPEKPAQNLPQVSVSSGRQETQPVIPGPGAWNPGDLYWAARTLILKTMFLFVFYFYFCFWLWLTFRLNPAKLVRQHLFYRTFHLQDILSNGHFIWQKFYSTTLRTFCQTDISFSRHFN